MKQSGNAIGTVWGLSAEEKGSDNTKVQIDFTQNDGYVFLTFNREVPWVGMTPDAAKHLAFAILDEIFGAREEEKAAMRAAQAEQPEVADLVEKTQEEKEG